MEWVVIIGIGLVIFGIFSTKSENKKAAKEEAERNAYTRQIASAKQELLTGPGTAFMPVLSPSNIDYRPVGKEKLLAVQRAATLMEMKSTGRYRTGSASFSIPIVKGIRYRVGSGTIRTEKEWQSTATGRLLITDKAVVFEGDQKNERITWTQVADVEFLSDGFIIAKRSGPPRTYQVDSPDPKFSAVMELMLARTA